MVLLAASWMLSVPLRVLVIVDWSLSIGVLGRIRGVNDIVKLAGVKDKLVRMHAVGIEN